VYSPFAGGFLVFRKLLVPLLAPALLLAQGRSEKRIVPDDIIFQFFFHRFSASESTAKAKGGSESSAKRSLKDKAGLTDTEISLVKEVALSCTDAYDAKSRSGHAEVRQLASRNTQKAAPGPAVAARIEALERERAQMVIACQDSLKRGMGATRYAKLETYVRAQGAAIRYIDPSSPDESGAPTPPPPGLIPTGRGPGQGGVQ
jgi:hypothetical protein